MKTITGSLAKMYSHIDQSDQVHYQLPLDNQLCDLNALIGQDIELRFTGKTACTYCGASIKKAYQQGYCFLATRKLAQCDMCILKPEQCHHHLGTCREPEWGDKHCMQDHIVYLSYASGIKVGITRVQNIPSRWIDQGATMALPILKVTTRRLSGLVEIELAKHIADKTNWRKMLQNSRHHEESIASSDLIGEAFAVSLKSEQNRLLGEISSHVESLKKQFGENSIEILDEPERHFYYPVQTVPEKISSYNFDKDPVIQDRLMGIKGQYLIFEKKVVNIRKFTGYEVELSVNVDIGIQADKSAKAKSGVCPFA